MEFPTRLLIIIHLSSLKLAATNFFGDKIKIEEIRFYEHLIKKLHFRETPCHHSSNSYFLIHEHNSLRSFNFQLVRNKYTVACK